MDLSLRIIENTFFLSDQHDAPTLDEIRYQKLSLILTIVTRFLFEKLLTEKKVIITSLLGI